MKITKEQQDSGLEFYQTIVAKSWEDQMFKANLIKNPKVAIEELIGQEISLPEGMSLVAEDQSDRSIIYLNIHRKIDINEFELSDEQLEMVAGGIFVLSTAAVVGLGALAVTAFSAGVGLYVATRKN